MNDFKLKTLEQVRLALDAVEDERDDITLSPAEKLVLEQTSVALRNIERSIIFEKEQDMVNILETDSKGLQDLIEQIKNSSKQLDGLATTLSKVCQAVEGLTKIVTTAIAAGLI